MRSAARAIAVAEKFHPGIVFLDIELPGMAGLDLANRLHHGARQHAMRLIALTTGVEHPKREDARIAGFERYLVKPLAQNELDKVLRVPQTPLAEESLAGCVALPLFRTKILHENSNANLERRRVVGARRVHRFRSGRLVPCRTTRPPAGMERAGNASAATDESIRGAWPSWCPRMVF